MSLEAKFCPGFMAAAQLFEKFSDCASLVLPEAKVEEVFYRVESLENTADMDEPVQLLGTVET